MGLIDAAKNVISGQLADQWKEFFICDSMDADTLMVKGKNRVTDRSSNTKGNDNIISNGSKIAVNVGQCMIIVEQGQVVELCAQPGEYIYDKSTEPSIFVGDLKENVKDILKNTWNRFTFGGDTGKDQRIYFINTKEIIGNKYGTPSPVPFRVVDARVGLDVDISIRCFGEYSYRIVDPIAFYGICGNVEDEYRRDALDGQLKTELLTALQPALGRLSEQGVRYSALVNHTEEIAAALNEVLSSKWGKRGIQVESFGVSSVKASEEDERLIKESQVYSNVNLAAAHMVGAQGQAMVDAANNQGGMGAAMGFMGMNMAGAAGGMNAGNLFAMGQQMQQQAAPQQPAGWTCSCGQGGNTGKFCAGCGQPKPEPTANAGWTCACGKAGNTGKFCAECGQPKPAEEGWTCTCGKVNKGKFCPECGKPKPAGAPLYQCDKCGWKPADPQNPPKFCPECGDVFDENDQI